MSKKFCRRLNTILFVNALCFFLLSCAIFQICSADDSVRIPHKPYMSDSVSPGPKMHEILKNAPFPSSKGPVRVTIEGAILLALENNRSLRIERLNPAIRRTFEDEERAAFDPTLTGEIYSSREKGQEWSRTSGNFISSRSNEKNADLGVSKFFSTGTDISIDLSLDHTWSDLYSDQYASRVGLSVTQALLRGMGTGVNLANLRQAQLDTRASQYELRGFAEALVARVEEIYWDYALSQRQIQIFEESLKLAEQQLKETQEIIGVGRLPETEITAAQAEIALRRQGLINARSAMATTRLQLLQLLNPPGPNHWQREIDLMNLPIVPEVTLDDVETHVEVALRMRPDLNQARLGVQSGDLEIVKTKNGILPKMDLFITLGKTGYADSFGSSVGNVTDDYYDFSVGVSFEYPFMNREAKASHRRSLLSREQSAEAVNNLANLVELDVRTAYIEVNRSKEQISATIATRTLQQEKLRIETEKFRVGRSTMFLLAQAQRDLLSSQITEIQAVVNYLKALVELHRLEGSLLERRGIVAPGREPVMGSVEK